MKIQEVILRAASGEILWIDAADIIGVSYRTMKRWKSNYEEFGYDGIFDRRMKSPSPKCAPLSEIQSILRLYRTHYKGFNATHFHEADEGSFQMSLCMKNDIILRLNRAMLRHVFTRSSIVTTQGLSRLSGRSNPCAITRTWIMGRVYESHRSSEISVELASVIWKTHILGKRKNLQPSKHPSLYTCFAVHSPHLTPPYLQAIHEIEHIGNSHYLPEQFQEDTED